MVVTQYTPDQYESLFGTAKDDIDLSAYAEEAKEDARKALGDTDTDEDEARSWLNLVADYLSAKTAQGMEALWEETKGCKE